jgi:3-oxoacyl-[acyl-carrier-protein] synthase II
MGRCVITGLGAVSPLGVGYQQITEALMTGRKAIRPITRTDVNDLEHHVGGQIDEEFDELASGRSIAQYSRCSRMALYSLDQALGGASLDLASVDPERQLLFLAVTLGPSEVIETIDKSFGDSGVAPQELLEQQWVHSAMQAVVTEFDFTGEAFLLSQGCSGANYGVWYAWDGIRRGEYDVALVGAVDTFSRVALVAYSRFGILTSEAIPFDVRRQGMVPAEAAGFLILESEEHAKRRGVPIFAEVLGGSATADAYQMLSPQPGGDALYRCMQGALCSADRKPEEVDYISACASGTPLGDLSEVRAIKRLFKPCGKVPPLSATKSQMGHAHAASAVIETIACVSAIQHGYLPATAGIDAVDEENDLDIVANSTRPAKVTLTLNNSSAFGGSDATIVIAEYRG